jgi:energy-coupling factor transporter ATP-binding protein EcfA2
MSNFDRRKSVETKASVPTASLAPDIPVSRNTKDITSHTTSKESNPFKAMNSVATGELQIDLDNQPPSFCEACEEYASPIWNCAYCGMDFCDPCWSKQSPHKRGRTGPDGLPHEKANPSIVRRFRDILTPPQEQLAQAALHREDEDTTWFGIAKDKDNKAILQDYGRYSAIMADSNAGEHQSRYPQLVSFVGQTGAGKSTLIRMLIEQQETAQRAHGWKFPTPVVGSISHGNVPTSGDVHLYSDPSTYSSEYPMLLADCEGLEGGENIPISAQYRDKTSTATDKKEKEKEVKSKKPYISKGINSNRRELKWATGTEQKKRQYAVTELYPRLLYTVSDVIVFVLRNPKYV